MSSTADIPDRHLYLPSLQAAELALASLPQEWQADENVERVRHELAAAVVILRGLN